MLIWSCTVLPRSCQTAYCSTAKIIGHAFFPSPFHMLINHSATPTAPSFSTTFVFDIITVGLRGGHGFTFAVAPSKELPEAGCCQYPGLLGTKNNGNFSNQVFAVEFDTARALQRVGLQSHWHRHKQHHFKCLQTASYYANNSMKAEPLNLRSGSPIQAWIDYMMELVKSWM